MLEALGRPPRILVAMRWTFFLGDIARGAFLLDVFHRSFGGATIKLAVPGRARNAAYLSTSEQPNPTRLYELFLPHTRVAGWRTWPESWGASFEFFRWLRREQFDVAIDLAGSPRLRLLLVAARIPVRLGLSFRPRDSIGLTHRVAVVNPPSWLNLGLGIAEVLGARAPLPERWLTFDPVPLEAEPTGPLVGIHAGGGGYWKRAWAHERYAELAARLSREQGAAIMLVGGAKEGEANRTLAQQIRARHPTATLIDRSGVDLNTLLSDLARVHVLVGNDSGPSGIAAAVGTRTVVVYGPTSPFAFGNSFLDRTRHAAVHGFASCQPCNTWKCRFEGDGRELQCLSAVTVDEVHDQVVAMLRRAGALGSPTTELAG